MLLAASQGDCRLNHAPGMQTLNLFSSSQAGKVLFNFKSKGVMLHSASGGFQIWCSLGLDFMELIFWEILNLVLIPLLISHSQDSAVDRKQGPGQKE